MGDAVALVSSAEETAKDLVRVLTELDLLHPHPDRPGVPSAMRVFEATGDPEAFLALAARFLGPAVSGVEPVHRHIAAPG
jgi:glutamate racemase